MSATSELLAEQVRQTDEQIAEARKAGRNTDELIALRDALVERLSRANQALTEGKQLLKS